MSDIIGYDHWKTTEPEYLGPDEEPEEEPTGSCDICGVNVYGSDLCDQCEWSIAAANGEVVP